MVTLLKRWNEFPVNSRVAVTRGQADVLLMRGMVAIDPPKKGKKKNAKPFVSHK